MHIILGGNGNIGSALSQELLSRNEAVTIVSRRDSSQAKWQKLGAQVAVADVNDTAKLRQVFKRGKRLFLLNPPAEPSTNIDLEERKSLASILDAIKNSGIEKIVAQSTYGAQTGEHIADLGVLHEMEQALQTQDIPFSIVRAAYFMSNWDSSLETAKEGFVSTLFPPEMKIPMVAPQDIGQFAASLMTDTVESGRTYNFEGPQRYSSVDVAQAFSEALQKPVHAVETPRNQWKQTMQEAGFSAKAAESFANMTAITIEGDFPQQKDVICGNISLSDYIIELIKTVENDQIG